MARLLDARPLLDERPLLDDRPLLALRPVLERLAVEREDVEREPPEREELERDPDERELVERLVLRDPLPDDPPLLAFVVREEREEVFDCVSAVRSWSKSLRACLLVLAALRRSATSAELTSL